MKKTPICRRAAGHDPPGGRHDGGWRSVEHLCAFREGLTGRHATSHRGEDVCRCPDCRLREPSN